MGIGLEDSHISALLWNAIFLVSAGLAAVLGKKIDCRWLVISMALFNINVAFVLDFFGLNAHLYELFSVENVEFNWAGKLTALTFSIVLLVTRAIEPRAAGVTFRQAKGATIGWGVLAALIVLDIYIALQLDNARHGVEAIAYQLTLPSLDEEIFYRGILLFTLIKAFGIGPRVLASNFGWAALISALIFGSIHAVFWSDGAVVFSAEAFAFAGLIGLLLTWLRLNTGSIVTPVLLHSAINTIWRVI